jgi:hypothetical protein
MPGEHGSSLARDESLDHVPAERERLDCTSTGRLLGYTPAWMQRYKAAFDVLKVSAGQSSPHLTAHA